MDAIGRDSGLAPLGRDATEKIAMCGIAGMIAHDPEARIGPALRAIEHRGRDDEGTFISNAFGSGKWKTCLGHRRLSIIDTSPAGHQPMFTEDRRYSIILNGEIYN